MALREENEAVAARQDNAERSLGRPRISVIDFRPFSGQEVNGISE